MPGRHFRQTAKRAGVPEELLEEATGEIGGRAELALQAMEALLPAAFRSPFTKQ